MNIDKWLELNAKVVILPVADEMVESYVSLVDEAYITFTGLEKDLKVYADRDLILVQNRHNVKGNTANVGFNEKEQKWYGWSHRAIYGFGIGSTVKPGDCAYMPFDKDDFLKDIVNFWTEDYHLNVKGTHQKGGVQVRWTVSEDVPNEDRRGMTCGSFEKYPDKWGRGTWEAKTIEDAKEMACDFAAGVS